MILQKHYQFNFYILSSSINQFNWWDRTIYQNSHLCAQFATNNSLIKCGEADYQFLNVFARGNISSNYTHNVEPVLTFDARNGLLIRAPHTNYRHKKDMMCLYKYRLQIPTQLHYIYALTQRSVTPSQ